MRNIKLQQSRRPAYLISFFGILSVILMILVNAKTLPPGIDWDETFRPVGQALYRFQSPYSVEGFRYPPWAALAVLPFAWLPAGVGRAVFLMTSLFIFGYSAFKLGAKPIALAAFLLSPPVLHCLLNANIDWLVLLGFVLPPPIGIFFVLIKPQMGIAVAFFWLIQRLRARQWKASFLLFAPVSAVTLLSFLVFGFWPLRFAEPVDYWWNASLWPASIPIGLALLTAAIRRSNIRFAMASSPCLSPYVLLHSWSGALAALVPYQPEMISAVVGLWIMVLLRVFQLAG